MPHFISLVTCVAHLPYSCFCSCSVALFKGKIVLCKVNLGTAYMKSSNYSESVSPATILIVRIMNCSGCKLYANFSISAANVLQHPNLHFKVNPETLKCHLVEVQRGVDPVCQRRVLLPVAGRPCPTSQQQQQLLGNRLVADLPAIISDIYTNSTLRIFPYACSRSIAYSFTRASDPDFQQRPEDSKSMVKLNQALILHLLTVLPLGQKGQKIHVETEQSA